MSFEQSLDERHSWLISHLVIERLPGAKPVMVLNVTGGTDIWQTEGRLPPFGAPLSTGAVMRDSVEVNGHTPVKLRPDLVVPFRHHDHAMTTGRGC